MKWFGKSWGAPICTKESHAETPVGEPCQWCEEPIEEDECGLLIPTVVEWLDDKTAREVFKPTHQECLLREVIGSVGHLQKLCSCYGGEMEDPPGMTKREAAKAAVALWQETEV